MARVKLGCLISGRGSNLQALIDACATPDFPAEIGLVLSNKPGVQGLERAEKAGIPTQVIRHPDFPDRAAFDAALDAALRAAGVEIVCLAGFMRLLTPEFVTGWGDNILNIHPSLLPAFKGLDTHQRALESGARFAGCTVHIVRPAMDEGPILVQAAVPILDGDTEDSLAARILTAEHRAYPEAVRLLAESRVRVEGLRCHIDAPADPVPHFNPSLSR
ncbi:phosphoribosylglycinamide formyltransferase [Elstera litoralis]|uniref:Phosphoribosylglycinamide formyltransferase n=1 Tax=Elstera litoralis TaxID=552518 RepID=A0A0F3IUS4_9PROT|nr:phosphoribosylglycinamide formyltransferase [Elstera litoralis]KJV10293.1 phosphoribosylglycinamide formyltransferase [Elstera litoralis]